MTEPTAAQERFSGLWWLGKTAIAVAWAFLASAIGYHHGRDAGREEQRCAIMAVLWEMNAGERPGELPPKNCARYTFERGEHHGEGK